MNNSIIESASNSFNNNFNFINSNGESNKTIVNLSDTIISNFKNLNNILNFKSGQYNLNNLQLNQCKSTIFIYIRQDENYGDSNLVISNLIISDNNDDISLLEISGYTKSISIDNIKNIPTNKYTKCNLNKFITMSTQTITNYLNQSNLKITNSNFQCFGSSFIKSLNIEFNNCQFDIFLTNNQDFISADSNCNLQFNNNTKFNIDNFNSLSYFLKVFNYSNVQFNNCHFKESSFNLISINSNSTVSILNTKFLNISNSIQLPFIDIQSSNLTITNSEISGYGSSFSSLIQSYQSNITISQLDISNSLFGSENNSMIYFIDTNTEINQLNLINCMSNNRFFSINTKKLSNQYYFILNNSTFKENHGLIGNNYQLFYFYYNIHVSISNCNFIKNSFSPMISTTESIITLDSIIYQNNSGSFLYSYWDPSLIINNFIYKDNKTPLLYLFSLNYNIHLEINNITIQNNFLGQFLFYSENNNFQGTLYIHGLIFKNNIIGNLDQNPDDVVYPFSIPTPYLNFYVPSQFIFSSSFVQMNNLIIEDNEFPSTFFLFHQSGINISNSVISNNKFLNVQENSNFVRSYRGQFVLINSTVEHNNGYTQSIPTTDNQNYLESKNNPAGLILLNATELVYFASSQFNNNSFADSRGSVMTCLTPLDTQNFVNLYITNSIFDSNSALIGGAIYLFLDFASVLTEIITNNSFINNYAKENGGAVYIDGQNFFNIDQLNNLNSFKNNKCLLGQNNICTGLKQTYPTTFSYYSDEAIEIKFSLVDYYGNTVYSIFGDFNTTIILKSVRDINETIYISTKVTAGVGSFFHTFYGYPDAYYLVELLGLPHIIVHISECAPHKREYYKPDSLKLYCDYCPIGSTYSDYDCLECDPNKATCQDSNIYSYDGYYMIDWSPLYIYSCPFDMCFKNNTCQSQLYTGDLCHFCSYQGNSKTGIQCCTHFKPFILIPILISIFIIFSLILSIIKYSQSQILSSIIIFIQTNSIVFFSYSGIYLLPAFRLSIDLIDGYCLFKWLDYNIKSFINYFIILIVFLIGSSDISFYLISKFTKNNHNIKKNNYISNSILQLSKFIKRILFKKKTNNQIIKIKSYWSLFQLIFIPLLFNILSLIIYKEKYVLDPSYHSTIITKFLFLDFTIKYLKSIPHIILFSISITILLILSIFLIILIIKCINLKKNNNNIFIKNILILNLNYNKKFKWWDFIIMFKSLIFISLSLFMLYYPNIYLKLVVFVQIVYSCCFFIFNPVKSNLESKIINYINLLQTLIFLIAHSSIFNSLGSNDNRYYLKGLTITILTFSVFLFYFIFKKSKL